MFAIGILAALCSMGQVAQNSKPTFTRERDVETAFQWTYVPRWDGAFLVGPATNHSNGPIIATIDGDGRREETLFTLQDAGHINVSDTAAASDGELAIVGDAFGNDRGTTFLARISPDRKNQVVTHVWPYCPMVVTFAPDGSLWTIGHIKDEANTREIANHVLRRFDPSGKLLGSTTLNVRGNLGDETTYLRSSGDRVSWFDTRINVYIEFSLDGMEMARYDGPVGANERNISGVGLSPDNEVVVGRSGKSKTELHMLDRETLTWVPVSIPPEFASNYMRVYGFDGTTLVASHTNTELRRFSTRPKN